MVEIVITLAQCHQSGDNMVSGGVSVVERLYIVSAVFDDQEWL
jgi:hypothetical protein